MGVLRTVLSRYADQLYSDHLRYTDQQDDYFHWDKSVYRECTVLHKKTENSDLRFTVFMFSVMTLLPFLFSPLFLASLAVLM